MSRRATGWTCQRTTKGLRCGYHNQPRTRKCAKCLKPRPERKPPAHMSALTDYDYEYYLNELAGGIERCMICGRKPKPGRRLDRDHEHVKDGPGRPRGLLCTVCNRRLPDRMTPEWLEAAAAYLRRST